jgi:hypothetical protein
MTDNSTRHATEAEDVDDDDEDAIEDDDSDFGGFLLADDDDDDVSPVDDLAEAMMPRAPPSPRPRPRARQQQRQGQSRSSQLHVRVNTPARAPLSPTAQAAIQRAAAALATAASEHTLAPPSTLRVHGTRIEPTQTGLPAGAPSGNAIASIAQCFRDSINRNLPRFMATAQTPEEAQATADFMERITQGAAAYNGALSAAPLGASPPLRTYARQRSRPPGANPRNGERRNRR